MSVDPTVVVAAITALATALGAAARLIYNDLKRERDFWRDQTLKSLGQTDKAIDTAEKKLPGA